MELGSEHNNMISAINNADLWFHHKKMTSFLARGPSVSFVRWMREEYGMYVEHDISGRPGSSSILMSFDDLEKLTMFKLEWS